MESLEPVESSEQTSPAAQGHRRKWLWLRIAGTVLCVAAMIVWVDFRRAWTQVRSADLLWFSAAFALLLLNSVQQAMRWRTMLGRRDIPVVKYLYFVFVGHFASLFMPSQVGSDALKAMAFGRRYGDIGLNVGVQLANRLAGLFALLLFSLGGLVWYWPRLKSSGAFEGFSIPAYAPLGALVLLPLGALALWWLHRHRKASWLRPLVTMAKDRRYCMDALGFALLVQLTSSLALVCLFWSVFPASDPGMVVFFTSISQVLLLLPLSVGGVGVREWTMLVLFSRVGGMPQEAVMAVVLLGYATLLGLAALGGLWMAARTWGLDLVRNRR